MRTNEEKLELMADIIEPASVIITDKRIALSIQEKGLMAALRLAISLHAREIVEILARIEGEDPATYQIDGPRLFMRLLATFNRPDIDIDALFSSQAQNGEKESSGPVTGNTEGGAK